MQDRFKFRVFDTELNEMLYVDSADEDIEFNYDGSLIGLTKKDHWHGGLNCIVMQCTGLKDKNGKLIYEGDIVKTNFDRDAVIGVISWCGKELRYYLNTTDYFDNKYVTDYEIYQTENYEVIGNIHENADLLENEECYSD